MPLRIAGVQHRGLSAPSITELEMVARFPGLATRVDFDLCVSLGHMVEVGGKYLLTPRGIKELTGKRRKR